MANAFHRSSGALALMALCLTACEPAQELPDRPAGPAASTPSPLPLDLPPPSRPRDANVLEAPLDVSDPQHIELLDVVRQATVLARRLEPEAELSGVRASPLLGGALKLRASDRDLAAADFHVARRDPTQPPGRDVQEAHVTVSLSTEGMLRARREARRDAFFSTFGSFPLPACPVLKAWDVAVASGMPGNAIASVSIWRMSAGRRPEWSFRVDGHDEHYRRVDAITCALNGPAAAPKPAPPANRPPQPIAKKDCGCAWNDPPCQWRCARGR